MTVYQFLSNEQLLSKYDSLSIDISCTRILLEEQLGELEIIEDYLIRRGINLDITKENDDST